MFFFIPGFVVYFWEPLLNVEEEKELIKQLPEAISAAQKQGFTVELGSKHYSDEWGETHVPTCRLREANHLVTFGQWTLKLAGFSENEAMRDGTYPYNQAGQAQLEKIFASGLTKN